MPVAVGARLILLHRQGQAMDEERDEARERETATAEILKIIAASPGDPQPAFDASSRARGACSPVTPAS